VLRVFSVESSEFRRDGVWGSRFRIQGSGFACGMSGRGIMKQALEFRVDGLWLRF